MIDVHAHFADEGYEFPAEWEKIRAAGVKKVILAADTLEHAVWHAKFCEEHDGAYFTVGIHPEFANSSPPPYPPPQGGGIWLPPRGELSPQVTEKGPTLHRPLTPLEELAAHKKCVAVGEIGLDYHYPDPDKTAQRALFEAQLEMAEALGLPVQIHSRDACADTLAILREHGRWKRGFLMHCYSYGAENLPAFLALGAYFSFGGVACFKNARHVAESVRACPMERILSETDSPYLSPFRGEKNTPANIPVIVEKLAQLKDVSLSEMTETIRQNAFDLFGI